MNRNARAVLDSFRTTTLTFDCYGTLVDWEGGACGALRDIYGYSASEVSDDTLIDSFLEADARIIRRNIFPYASVLTAVAREISERLHGKSDPALETAFANSLPSWPVFEETNMALHRLAERYRLAIISNVDDRLLSQTVERFDVPFDIIMTSEQSRCYKPNIAIFQKALQLIGDHPSNVVHIAEGLCEAKPAGELGMRSIWVKRSQRSDDGSKARPDATVATLTELVESLS